MLPRFSRSMYLALFVRMHWPICRQLRLKLRRALRRQLNPALNLKLHEPFYAAFYDETLAALYRKKCRSFDGPICPELHRQLQPSRRPPGRSPHGSTVCTGAKPIVVPTPGRYHALRCRQWASGSRPYDKSTYHADSVFCICKFQIINLLVQVARRRHPRGRDYDPRHDSRCGSGCRPGNGFRYGTSHSSSNDTGHGSCHDVGYGARHDTRNGAGHGFRNGTGHVTRNDAGCGSDHDTGHGTGHGSGNDIRHGFRHLARYDSGHDSSQETRDGFRPVTGTHFRCGPRPGGYRLSPAVRHRATRSCPRRRGQR